MWVIAILGLLFAPLAGAWPWDAQWNRIVILVSGGSDRMSADGTYCEISDSSVVKPGDTIELLDAFERPVQTEEFSSRIPVEFWAEPGLCMMIAVFEGVIFGTGYDFRVKPSGASGGAEPGELTYFGIALYTVAFEEFEEIDGRPGCTVERQKHAVFSGAEIKSEPPAKDDPGAELRGISYRHLVAKLLENDICMLSGSTAIPTADSFRIVLGPVRPNMPPLPGTPAAGEEPAVRRE